MHHSTQNTILTKLSLWEYGNGVAQFSRRKYSRVLHLVHYGTPAGFHACVYSTCQHARARMSRSPSNHQAYWCVSHTRGNQCYLVTCIRTIPPRLLCTHYDTNMHQQQMPWAHTHATRLSALMARKGRSRCHEGPSYKVHDHPYICRYIYTYMHHAQCYHIEQESKQTLSTS